MCPPIFDLTQKFYTGKGLNISAVEPLMFYIESISFENNEHHYYLRCKKMYAAKFLSEQRLIHELNKKNLFTERDGAILQLMEIHGQKIAQAEKDCKAKVERHRNKIGKLYKMLTVKP